MHSHEQSELWPAAPRMSCLVDLLLKQSRAVNVAQLPVAVPAAPPAAVLLLAGWRRSGLAGTEVYCLGQER